MRNRVRAMAYRLVAALWAWAVGLAGYWALVQLELAIPSSVAQTAVTKALPLLLATLAAAMVAVEKSVLVLFGLMAGAATYQVAGLAFEWWSIHEVTWEVAVPLMLVWVMYAVGYLTGLAAHRPEWRAASVALLSLLLAWVAMSLLAAGPLVSATVVIATAIACGVAVSRLGAPRLMRGPHEPHVGLLVGAIGAVGMAGLLGFLDYPAAPVIGLLSALSAISAAAVADPRSSKSRQTFE